MSKAQDDANALELDLLEDSKRAVIVLQRLIAKLEVYTSRVEDELVRREAALGQVEDDLARRQAVLGGDGAQSS